MRISVDHELCDARGRCNMVDPEVFTLDRDGYSNIGQGKQLPAGKAATAEQGVEACPVQALRID